ADPELKRALAADRPGVAARLGLRVGQHGDRLPVGLGRLDAGLGFGVLQADRTVGQVSVVGLPGDGDVADVHATAGLDADLHGRRSRVDLDADARAVAGPRVGIAEADTVAGDDQEAELSLAVGLEPHRALLRHHRLAGVGRHRAGRRVGVPGLLPGLAA